MWNFQTFYSLCGIFYIFSGIIRFPCFSHILRNEVFNKLICEFQFSTKLVENIVLVEFDFSKADDFDLRVRLANLCVFVLALLFMQKTLRKSLNVFLEYLFCILAVKFYFTCLFAYRMWWLKKKEFFTYKKLCYFSVFLEHKMVVSYLYFVVGTKL